MVLGERKVRVDLVFAGILSRKYGTHAYHDTKLWGLQLSIQLWPGTIVSRPRWCVFCTMFSAVSLKEEAYQPAAMSWHRGWAARLELTWWSVIYCLKEYKLEAILKENNLVSIIGLTHCLISMLAAIWKAAWHTA